MANRALSIAAAIGMDGKTRNATPRVQRGLIYQKTLHETGYGRKAKPSLFTKRRNVSVSLHMTRGRGKLKFDYPRFHKKPRSRILKIHQKYMCRVYFMTRACHKQTNMYRSALHNLGSKNCELYVTTAIYMAVANTQMLVSPTPLRGYKTLL